MKVPNFFGEVMGRFSFENIPKNLDLSHKTDLDSSECFQRKMPSPSRILWTDLDNCGYSGREKILFG